VDVVDRMLRGASVAALVAGAGLVVASVVGGAQPGARAAALPAPTTSVVRTAWSVLTATTARPRPTVRPVRPVRRTTTTRATTPTTTTAAIAAPPTTATPSPVERIVAFALAQRGKPYVYAAAGPDAYDCSGLVLAAYGRVGVALPHASVLQARSGRHVDWRREGVRPGDLVFMRGGDPVVDLGHVGIALSGDEWVTAPHRGAVVHRAPIPFGAIEEVRRLLDR
jgi:cell wall-associated NlpC family hydrolase